MRKQGIERLDRIKDFLLTFGAADMETLSKLFFPSRHRAQVVLQEWTNKKELKRKRLEQFIYYLPSYKGDLKPARLYSRFYASQKDLPSWWVVKYQEGLYTCIKLGKEGVRIRPGLTDAKPLSGEATVNIHRAGTLKEAISQYIKI